MARILKDFLQFFESLNAHSVTFDEVWEQRVEARIENVSMHFISRELLIRNKRATGLAQDLADLESLSSESAV